MVESYSSPPPNSLRFLSESSTQSTATTGDSSTSSSSIPLEHYAQ